MVDLAGRPTYAGSGVLFAAPATLAVVGRHNPDDLRVLPTRFASTFEPESGSPDPRYATIEAA